MERHKCPCVGGMLHGGVAERDEIGSCLEVSIDERAASPEPGLAVPRRRSLAERLLSFPWRPLAAVERIPIVCPDRPPIQRYVLQGFVTREGTRYFWVYEGICRQKARELIGDSLRLSSYLATGVYEAP